MRNETENKNLSYEDRIFGLKVKTFAILIILLITAGGTTAYGFSRSITLDVGQVGIILDPLAGTKTLVGTGTEPVWQPFALFFQPWASLKVIDVSTDSIHMWGNSSSGNEQTDAEHYPAIKTQSKDGLSVEVDVTVRWRLAPSGVIRLYELYPQMDYQDRLIIPTIREVVRNVVPEYYGIQIFEQRQALDASIAIAMEEAFSSLPSIGDVILYDEMNMRGIELPNQFVQAIEDKLSAEQSAAAALFYAEEIVTLAQADADALIISALAIANATLIQANASAQAVFIQAQSIGDAVALLANITGTENATQIAMMYLWIQALQVIADSTGNATFFITFGEGGIPYVYTVNPATP